MYVCVWGGGGRCREVFNLSSTGGELAGNKHLQIDPRHTLHFTRKEGHFQVD